MNCPSDQELLGWLDDPASQNDAVHAHIDNCEACRAAMAHVAALDEAPHVDCIGRYELDTPLGAGGMGMVWRAWDPQLHRHVAVKVLRADSANGRARLLAEARALAKLQDPHVVAVHDVGEFDGEVFVATELVDGESLATWQIKQSWADVIAAYVQAAEGLAAAHRVGLVHRDIKPHNLFIDRAGRVRVGDFGLARGDAEGALAVGADASASNPRLALGSQTATGSVVGTPAYMAPEQRTGHTVDARADQFAWALSLVEGLVGVRPEAGVSAAALQGLARSAGGGASGTPTAVWSVLARSLSVAAADRFRDMRELIGALSVAVTMRSEAPALQAPNLTPSPATVAPRSHAWLVGAVVGTAAIVGGVAWWQLREGSSGAPVAAPAPAQVPVAPVVVLAGSGSATPVATPAPDAPGSAQATAVVASKPAARLTPAPVKPAISASGSAAGSAATTTAGSAATGVPPALQAALDDLYALERALTDYRTRMDFKGALTVAQKALATHPNDPMFLATTGLLACQAADEKLARQLHAMLKDPGRNAMEQTCIGSNIYLTGDLIDSAAGRKQQAYEFLKKGQALVAKGDFANAIPWFEKMFAIDHLPSSAGRIVDVGCRSQQPDVVAKYWSLTDDSGRNSAKLACALANVVTP